ncbi:hypothetical protein HK101_005884, partial [Irineochytrium annulatum]
MLLSSATSSPTRHQLQHHPRIPTVAGPAMSRALGTLCAGEVVTICAVLMAWSPPKKTRGTDFVLAVKVADQTNGELGINLFKPSMEQFPSNLRQGSVLLLTHIYIDSFNNKPSGTSRKVTEITVHDQPIPEPAFIDTLDDEGREICSSPPVRTTQAAIINALLRWWTTTHAAANPPGGASSFIQPYRAPRDPTLVANIREGLFFDLNCQVIDILS